jgi:hypothetical protein
MTKKIYLNNLNDQVIADYASTVSFFDAFECNSGIEQNWVYGPWKGRLRTSIINLIKLHVKEHRRFPTNTHKIYLYGKLHGQANAAREVAVRFPNLCPHFELVDGKIVFDKVWDIRCDASLSISTSFYSSKFPEQVLRKRPTGIASTISKSILNDKAKFLFDLGYSCRLKDDEYAFLKKLILLVIDLNQFPPNGHHILNILFAIVHPNRLELSLALKLIHQYEKDTDLPLSSIATPYLEAKDILHSGVRDDVFYQDLVFSVYGKNL